MGLIALYALFNVLLCTIALLAICFNWWKLEEVCENIYKISSLGLFE